MPPTLAGAARNLDVTPPRDYTRGRARYTNEAILDENARVPVNTLAKKILGQLCRRTRATVLVTAHPSKASVESGAYYAGSTAWNGAYRSRMVLKVDPQDPAKRTLVLAKSNYSAAEDIDLFMQDGLLIPKNAPSAILGAERELTAVRDLMFLLIERGTQVVRSNGNGLKPRDRVAPLTERGVRVTPRRVLEHLATPELQGALRYLGADKNVRGARAGFVKGPSAGPPGAPTHVGGSCRKLSEAVAPKPPYPWALSRLTAPEPYLPPSPAKPTRPSDLTRPRA